MRNGHGLFTVAVLLHWFFGELINQLLQERECDEKTDSMGVVPLIGAGIDFNTDECVCGRGGD